MDVIGHGHYKQDLDGEEYRGDENERDRYLERINGGLKPGAKITVIGHILSSAERIDFDLCERASGIPKSMHFNPRFASRTPECSVVIRNSCTTASWGREEGSSTEGAPFKRGNLFKLVIRCEKDQFHFTVDDVCFCTYKYRVPLQNAKYLRVLGGLNVIHAEIKN